MDNTQHQDPELTRNISFQILSPNPLLPQLTHKIHVPVSQVYHLTEEIKCRNDSFIAPSKALVNRGRGSVEIQNSITLRGSIYMVLSTRDNPFPEFPWPSLLLTYFFVKGNYQPTIHMKTASLSLGPDNSQLRRVSCLTPCIFGETEN